MWLSWLAAVVDWVVLARKKKQISMMKMHSNVQLQYKKEKERVEKEGGGAKL